MHNELNYGFTPGHFHHSIIICHISLGNNITQELVGLGMRDTVMDRQRGQTSVNHTYICAVVWYLSRPKPAFWEWYSGMPSDILLIHHVKYASPTRHGYTGGHFQ